jgi:signal transduction histidine kinase
VFAYGIVRFQPPPPGRAGAAALALVLAILAIASLMVARRLVRPLGRLVATAQAFGEGDVRVRVGLPPRGALGALGAVFDEMAGRVARLLQAQRELLANVSHELRTPLSRMRVALELAAESEDVVVATELHAAEEDLAQLEHMVEDVLRVASLDLATLQPADTHAVVRRERLDLAALAARTTRRFAAACPERAVTLDAPERSLWVDGDAELLRRALDNLLDNARKYSEPGARIGVFVTADGGQAVLTVVDAGIGIDSADQQHVFTPFFRADRSRARASGGVGLGLTLVQRITAAHGGAVVLASSPGQGTRVTLRIPQA